MAEFFLHKSSPTYLHPENADVMSISQFMAQNLRQPPPPIPPPPKHTFEISEGESVEIEKIVAAEKKDGQLYYKVKWVKYTWEAEESIQHLPHLIDGYWREHFYQNINQAAAIDTTGINLVNNENDYARNKSVVVTPHDNREVQKHVVAGNVVTAAGTENQVVNGAAQGITATATVIDNNEMMLEFTMGAQQTNKALEQAYQNRVPQIANNGSAEKKIRRTYPLERKYCCTVCSKAFDRNTSLTRHMLVHTREKPFKCQQCDKAFSQNAHLKRHVLIHIGQKSYQCNKCGKMFIEKGGLARHEATHSTDKPWVCNQCGKAFVLNEYLQRHLFLHTGQKPYQCNECGRLFADGSSWRAHKLTHNKEKKYKCHVCSKMLKCKRNFKKHVMAHSEEKELKHHCQVCSLRFPSKKLLVQHLRKGKIHHRCKVCRKLLKTKENYEQHMATHDPTSDTYDPEVKMADPNDPDEKDDEYDEEIKSDDESVKSEGKEDDDEEEDKMDDDEEEEEEEDDDDDDEDEVNATDKEVSSVSEVLLNSILERQENMQAVSEAMVQATAAPSSFTALILKPEHVNQLVPAPIIQAQGTETGTLDGLQNRQALVNTTVTVPNVLEVSNVSVGLTVPMDVTPTIDVVGTPESGNLVEISQVGIDTSVASHVALQPNAAFAALAMQSNDSSQIAVSNNENPLNVQTSVAVANPSILSDNNMLSTDTTATDADVAETIILITQNNDEMQGQL